MVSINLLLYDDTSYKCTYEIFTLKGSFELLWLQNQFDRCFSYCSDVKYMIRYLLTRLTEKNYELQVEYESVSCQLQAAEEEIDILKEEIAKMQDKVLSLSTARMLRKRNNFFFIDQPRLSLFYSRCSLNTTMLYSRFFCLHILT